MAHKIPRLVVIDDDDEVLEMLLLHLSLHDVEVVSFSDPTAALEYICNNVSSIDGILSDLNLNPITGIDLLKKTHSLAPALPFYIMSGNASSEEIEAAKALNVTGILDKIAMLNQLGAIVDDIKSRYAQQMAVSS
jgi:DNA-binding NtrC family response regulator